MSWAGLKSTYSTQWADSADKKWWYLFFLFSSENSFWYFMQIETVCIKCQSLFFGENKKKYFKMSSTGFFTQHAKLWAIEKSLMTNLYIIHLTPVELKNVDVRLVYMHFSHNENQKNFPFITWWGHALLPNSPRLPPVSSDQIFILITLFNTSKTKIISWL